MYVYITNCGPCKVISAVVQVETVLYMNMRGVNYSGRQFQALEISGDISEQGNMWIDSAGF